MLVWLIKDGETLPVQAGTRAMRTGMLVAELVKRGHSVIWWSGNFWHQMKHFSTPTTLNDSRRGGS